MVQLAGQLLIQGTYLGSRSVSPRERGSTLSNPPSMSAEIKGLKWPREWACSRQWRRHCMASEVPRRAQEPNCEGPMGGVG